MERQLATIRRIAEVRPIEGADAIEAVRVDGWWVVAKKGEYEVDDLAVYLEVDSWVPHELAPFLSKGEPREFNGVKGERLRTIKLRGQLSQGLLLPTYIVSDIVSPGEPFAVEEGDDVTEILNIQKWEKPLDPRLAGTVRGNFPSFIPKTDQPRIQNLSRELEKYATMQWEVTEKLDGSSMTIYVKDDYNGVCSRNLDLKEDINNSFWNLAIEGDYHACIRTTGRNLAVQGELIGSGIQGNLYNMSGHAFYCYDIFDIDEQRYLLPDERQRLCFMMAIQHVPVLGTFKMVSDVQVDQLLELAEDKSKLNHKAEREGVVFKSLTSDDSFKVISNKWLLKNGE